MLELLQNLGIVAGGLIALGVIWTKGLKPLYRFLRKMGEVHDYILVELPEWQEKVNHGLKQLYPNGGSSIHDKVNRTDRSINEIRNMLEEHINDKAAHQPQVSVNVHSTAGDTPTVETPIDEQ